MQLEIIQILFLKLFDLCYKQTLIAQVIPRYTQKDLQVLEGEKQEGQKILVNCNM